jgi:hypothetical protein
MSLRHKYIIFLVTLFIPFATLSTPQEAKVSQHKIARDKKKKDKIAEKEYNKAVKAHIKRQSPETKSMMKSSKKASKKTLPHSR